MRRGSSGSVPLARRQLTARRGRVGVGATGIGLAIMVILLLDGLWSGVQQRSTTYEDHIGAQLAVIARGTESLFADPGVLPSATVQDVAGVEGVLLASGVRTMYAILELHSGKAAVALVGAEPGGLGGPWRLAEGRVPVDGEAVVDATFAYEHRLAVGDVLPVLGEDLVIVGLTEETAMFMTPLVFTTQTTLASLLGAPQTTGAVLVTTSDPDATGARLRAAGYSVRTAEELHDAALRLATRIYGGPVRLMVGVAFAAAVLVIALVAYTFVVEHRRDFGVLKALGATTGRLRRVALAQTMVLTSLGWATAVLLLLGARYLIAAWRPDFPVVLTGATLARVALATVVMAALAGWLPARQVTRTDAAAAFRTGQ